MAEAGTLHDAFIDELRDAYDAEKQLTKALPKLAKAAARTSCARPSRAISKKRRARSSGSNRCSRASTKRSAASTATASPASSKKASPSWRKTSTTHDGRLSDRRGPAGRALRDGRLRHARRVGAGDGPHRSGRLLQQTLDEEKAADKKLTALAEGGINQDAASQAHAANGNGNAGGEAKNGTQNVPQVGTG